MREADFDRLHRANCRMATAWADIAGESLMLKGPLHFVNVQVAFAYKMSDYYEQRAADCQNLYSAAKQSSLARKTDTNIPL